MNPFSPWRLCVAPMMDWTDRHCRVFHRLISPSARLYTEMVTTGALIHGDKPRHLDFSDVEHPVALQLGGSEPGDLAICAKLGEQWGYDEINLNCGCPSERVQRGAFGACLMAEPQLVRDCVKAMVDAVSVPVTVKHRIGIDQTEDYGFVRDFVGTVSEGGASVFIVHARNAWLKGLSPKENREVPPLRYEFVARLAQDFPALTFVLNGGIKTAGQARGLLGAVDLSAQSPHPNPLPQAGEGASKGPHGVMIGREAYHNPWSLREMDAQLFDSDLDISLSARMAVWHALMQYIIGARRENKTHPFAALRHALGLFNGLSGARRWRQMLSDPRGLGAMSDAQLLALEAPRVTRPLIAEID
ncbi:MAG: tRNA dihydrouridine(20/20a) synthase DusA [Burkholderiaceae bacterium]